MQVQPTYKEIWKIAYPITIGSMAQTILGITDTAFLARVGEIELGSSAIGGVFYFVLVMLGMGYGIGSQILMARKAGENNAPAIGRIFDHSMVIMLLLALVLFLLISFFGKYFFSQIIHSPLIVLGAGQFIKYRIWGIFFVMASTAFRAFYVGISQTRIITYSAILMASLNVVLDYLLIFGHYGFPRMGLAGAAMASSIAEAVAALYLIIYTAFKSDIKNFGLFKFKGMTSSLFSEINRLSSPIVVQNIISMGAWFAFFVFIERLGEHDLAISNIVRSNYMILMTPMWGFASAANSMVSNLIGQRKPEEVMKLLRKIITMSLSTALFLVTFYIIFARPLLHLTASDDRLLNDCLPSFYITCAATVVFSFSMMLFSAVSGTGATKAAMFLEISNITLYLAFVYVCSVILKTPVEVVWLSEVLYWTMMGAFSYMYLKSHRWKLIQL